MEINDSLWQPLKKRDKAERKIRSTSHSFCNAASNAVKALDNLKLKRIIH